MLSDDLIRKRSTHRLRFRRALIESIAINYRAKKSVKMCGTTLAMARVKCFKHLISISMKRIVFTLLLLALTSSSTFAQAWRPKPKQQTTTTTTTRVYTAPSTRTHVTIHTHHAKRTGVANARAHGGVAHAYGHYKKQTVVKVHRER
jgi:hypothetical protein